MLNQKSYDYQHNSQKHRLHNQQSISVLMQKITDYADDDKQGSTKDRYIPYDVRNTICTSQISRMKAEDAAQCDGNDSQEREQHVVGGLDHPLIALSIAYIDQKHKGDKDASEKNSDDGRDIHAEDFLLLHVLCNFSLCKCV
jgi:hypothetical protein